MNGSVNAGMDSLPQLSVHASPIARPLGCSGSGEKWSLWCFPSCRAKVRSWVMKARALTERVNFVRSRKWSRGLLFWEPRFPFGPGIGIRTVFPE